jgi:hypothetical protein
MDSAVLVPGLGLCSFVRSWHWPGAAHEAQHPVQARVRPCRGRLRAAGGGGLPEGGLGLRSYVPTRCGTVGSAASDEVSHGPPPPSPAPPSRVRRRHALWPVCPRWAPRSGFTGRSTLVHRWAHDRPLGRLIAGDCGYGRDGGGQASCVAQIRAERNRRRHIVSRRGCRADEASGTALARARSARRTRGDGQLGTERVPRRARPRFAVTRRRQDKGI